MWSAAYAGPRSRHLGAVGVRDSARRVAGAAVSVMLGSEASVIRVVARAIGRSRVPVLERPPVLIRRNTLENRMVRCVQALAEFDDLLDQVEHILHRSAKSQYCPPR